MPSIRRWIGTQRQFRLIVVAIPPVIGLCFALFIHINKFAFSQILVPLEADSSAISLDSKFGRRLLVESRAAESFVPLSMYFTTQENTAYCGVATCTMLLNASKIPRPVSPEHGQYKLFTQVNIFTDQVREIAPPDRVRSSGMTLQMFGEILRSFSLEVQVHFAQDRNSEEFRRDAIEVLRRRDRFLAVNYLRKSIGQDSGGHISPIAAYHEGEDRFLVLDVARYKYPPVWIKSAQLWDAMRAVDGDSNLSRGYVVVWAKKKEEH